MSKQSESRSPFGEFRRLKRATTLLLAGIAGLYAYALLHVPRPVRRGAFARTGPLLIAHRGGSIESPENTLIAFETALRNGAHALELDIQLTACGTPVVLHDETLDRTTSGSGPVADLSLDQLQDIDAAYHWNPGHLPEPPLRGTGITVPTLEEVFIAFPGVPLMIDIKPTNVAAVVPAIGSLIEHYNLWDWILIASFDQKTIRAFRRQYPRALTSAGRAEVARFYLLQRIGLAGLHRTRAHSFLLPEFYGRVHLLSPSMLRALRRRGVDVYVWTLDEKEDMLRMIELEVQGIITGNPALLNSLLQPVLDNNTPL